MVARTLVAVPYAGVDRLTDRSLESVVRLRSPTVDVLVFDDRPRRSGHAGRPEGGGREVCDRQGIAYYPSPRPLGPARTMNLAFLRALSAGYGAVLRCDPHVIVPVTVVGALAGLAAGARVGSVAAWAPSLSTALTQDTVDWIATDIAGEPPLDVPTSGGSCVLFHADALREVGLFDPLYVSGDDHVRDWAVRAGALGYRCVAAPGVQVSGGHRLAGTAGPLFRFRHPGYEGAAVTDGSVAEADERAARAVVIAAARRFGYTLEIGWQNGPAPPGAVRVTVEPDGARPVASGVFSGFSATLDVDRGRDVIAALSDLLGCEPHQVIVSERGRFADAVVSSATTSFMYPKRV